MKIPRASLKRAFQVVFLASVGVPLLFLIRLGWDNHQQSQELGRREILDRQKLIADGWLGGLFQYRQGLRQIGGRFGQVAGRSLAGSRDPRLWFGHSSKFFQRVKEKKPHNFARYTSAYARYMTLYNQLIARSVSLDVSSHDEIQSPLKVQLYALEHSYFFERIGYRPGDAIPEELPDFYFMDLLKDALPRDDIDFLDEKKRNRWLRDSGLFQWFDHLPMHPVIYQRTSMGGLMWDEVMGIVRNVLCCLLFTEEVAAIESRNFQDLMRLSIAESRRQWLPLKLFAKELEFYWDIVPSDWSWEKWKAGEEEAPQGAYMAILDQSELLDGYFEFFEAGRSSEVFAPIFGEARTAVTSTPDATVLAEELAREGFLNHGRMRQMLALENMHFEVIQPPRKERSGERKLVAFPDGSTRSSIVASESSSVDFLAADFHIGELLRTLDEETGQYRLSRAGLFEEVGDFEKISGVSRDTQALLVLLNRLNRPLQFRFEKSGESYLGTLHPANELGDQVLFLYQPVTPLLKKLQTQGYYILGGILLALILAAGIGRILASKTIGPILELTTMISHLASGELNQRARIRGRNEIARLAWHFNGMAQAIEDRLWQMETVQNLHGLLNQQATRSQMLQFILQKLQSRLGARWGAVGFFSGRISTRAEDWVLEGESAHKALKKVQSEEFKGIEGLEVIKGDEDILVAFQKQEAPEGLSGKFQGVLMLGQPEKLEMEPVKVLFEQGRTAMLKSVLDEIRADTLKGWEIQESLMPQEKPDTQGRVEISSSFVAARGLAGDYYDYLTHALPDELGVSIADVSGKGIGPSLFGATSRAILRVLARKDLLAGEQLNELNTRLCFRKSSSLFLTMFYARFLLKEGRLEYASAGHNRMFLIHQDGGFEFLSAKGLPAGVFDGGFYETKSLKLQDGDLLCLYTDGVTEHENAHQELYGDEKFENFLKEHHLKSTDEISRLLVEDLQKHRGGVSLSDDVTFVFARYNPGGEA